jgi:NAD(P)-dependent dehydrogenase (short-subunit alcohol dehydrogenase family)
LENLADNWQFDRSQQIMHLVVLIAIAAQKHFFAALGNYTKGREAALAFAREGAKVVAADISEQGNQETVHLIEDQGGQAIASNTT